MVDWILLSFSSALFLGIYDCLKKKAVHKNAAITTLFFSTTCGGFLCLGLLIWRHLHISSFSELIADFPTPSLFEFLLIFAKSTLVSCSWVFAYLSLKHLPLSIVAPIRSSGPLWTLFLAWFTFSELPNFSQLLAFSLTLGSYLWFSLLGKKDRLKIFGEPWVLCILIGTWLGAVSAIYDKWLIQVYRLHPMSILLHFFVGMIFFQGAVLLMVQRMKSETTVFRWRWSIPFVSLALIASDALYFYALTSPDAFIALVSTMRRGSLLVSFILSLWILREPQARGKLLPIIGIFLGLAWIGFSDQG